MILPKIARSEESIDFFDVLNSSEFFSSFEYPSAIIIELRGTQTIDIYCQYLNVIYIDDILSYKDLLRVPLRVR